MAGGEVGALRVALGLDSASFETGSKKAEQAYSRFVRGVRSSSSAAASAAGQVERSAQAAANAAALMTRALAGLSVGLLAREVVGLADAYTRYTNALKVAGLEGQALRRVQDALFGTAQKYGVQLEALGLLYGRVAPAAAELGASQKDLVTFTNAVAAAIKAQGGSAEAAQGALLQLGQALGSPIVRAEEFNSIMEGARPLVQAVANNIDRFGGSVAKLRAEVLAGKVTSQEFFRALIAGSGELEAKAGKANLTIAGSWQTLTNALARYIGETDASLGATARVTAAIGALANNLDHILPVVTALTALIGVRYAAAGAVFVATEAGRAVALARVTLATEAAAAANLKLATTGGAATASAARMAASITGLSVAARVGQTGLASLLGLVGGPWGLAILGATAAAWGLAAAINRGSEVTKDQKAAAEGASKSIEAYEKAVVAATAATGAERVEAQNAVAAGKAVLQQDLAKAKGKLKLAQDTLTAVKAEMELRAASGDPDATGAYALSVVGKANRAQTEATQAQARIAEITKSIKDGEAALKAFAKTEQQQSSQYLQSLKDQRAELGKSQAQLILMRAEREAAKPENKANAAAIMAEARALSAATAAQEARTKGIKASAGAANQAKDRAEDYLRSLREQNAEIGKSEAEVSILRARGEAAAAAAAGFGELADAILEAAQQQVALNAAQALLDRYLPQQSRRLEDVRAGLQQLREEVAAGKRPIEDLGDVLQNIEWEKLTPAKPLELPPLDTSAIEESYDRADALARDSAMSAEQAFFFATNSIAQQFDDLHYSLENLDWGRALDGLARVVDGVEAAFSQSGQLSGKIAAAAGVAGGFAGLIGGSGGQAVAGAASGLAGGASLATALGMSLAVPGVGWAVAGVGALIGGLGALLGGSSAKKKERQAAEEKARQEAAQKAQAIADAKRQLEIEMLRAQGKEIEAVAMERQDELDKLRLLDPALAEAQDALWKVEDAARHAADMLQLQARFNDLFLSDTEKLAEAQKSVQAVFDELGLGMVQTKEGFRALVDGLDQTTEEGAAAYEALLKIAPVFAEIAQSAGDLQESAKSFTDSIFGQAFGGRTPEEVFAQRAPTDEQVAHAGRIAATARLMDEQAQAAEASAKALEALTQSVGAAREALMRAGDGAAWLASEVQLIKLDKPFGDYFNKDGGFNAGGFNFDYAMKVAGVAARLVEQASANALKIRDVMGLMGPLVGAWLSPRDPSLGGRTPPQLGGDGVSAIMGLRYRAQFAREDFLKETGLTSVVGDLLAYQLRSPYESERITNFDAVARGMGFDPAELRAVAEAYVGEVDGLARAAAEAGVSSIRYYFGELGKASDALMETASETGAAIGKLDDSLGRLKSLADVMTLSAGVGLGGGYDPNVDKALRVAEAAAVAAEVLTTAQAKALAKSLAADPAFAGEDNAAVKQAALLLDGLAPFDTEAFEAVFTRLNAALGRDQIDERQYETLVARALGVTSGLDEELDKTRDEFAQMRKAARDFRDELLLDGVSPLSPGLKLQEATRQLEDAFRRVMGGDTAGFDPYRAAQQAQLQAGLASLSDGTDYAVLFAKAVSRAGVVGALQPDADPQFEVQTDQLDEIRGMRTEVAKMRGQMVDLLELQTLYARRSADALEELETYGLPS